MNAGDPEWKDQPVFIPFALIPYKIVNELSRIPEATQSLFLDSIETGEWGYLRKDINTGIQPVFFTANYMDKGSNTIIPALMDRISVAVETKTPGITNRMIISRDFHNRKDEILKDQELYRKALDVLNSDRPYEEIRKDLRQIQEEFRQKLEERGITTLTEEELEQVESEIERIPFEEDAEIYQMFLMSELDLHPKFGQKRSNDPVTNEFGNYLYSCFIGSDSERAQRAIARYSQGLAWLQNQKEVNLDHLMQVAPYVLWHRLKWNDETKSKFRSDDRDDPLDLHITKQLLGDGTQEIPGVKKRFVESKENYQGILGLIKDNKLDEARSYAERYAASGKGHPIFLDTLKDLK